MFVKLRHGSPGGVRTLAVAGTGGPVTNEMASFVKRLQYYRVSGLVSYTGSCLGLVNLTL
eukprot:1177201-Prorocentrum_minimum.AAC.1